VWRRTGPWSHAPGRCTSDQPHDSNESDDPNKSNESDAPHGYESCDPNKSNDLDESRQ
jgi:hypothetical protein